MFGRVRYNISGQDTGTAGRNRVIPASSRIRYGAPVRGRPDDTMQMSFQEILNRVTAICRAQQVKELCLFGSYAKGTATANSDIDLVVSGVKDKDSLEEAIDNIDTLKKIDLFYKDDIQDPILLKEIEKYGKKIYSQI